MSVSPWIGIFDTDITASARKEYAVVYLFDTQMQRIYLSLNQGSTQYEHSIGKKGKYAAPGLHFENTEDAVKAITKNAKLAQDLLRSSQGFSFKDIDLSSNIDPCKGKVERNFKYNLAYGYELGNILSKCYEIDKIPSQEAIIEDLFNIIGIHRELKGLLNGKSITQIDQEDYRVPINNITPKKEFNDKSDKENEENFRVAVDAKITGDKAEEIFELQAEDLVGHDVKNMTGKTGLGYDFISIDKNNFFEIKGFRNDLGDWRMTRKEWKVAKEKGNNYFLVLISNLDNPGYEKIKIVENPYNRYKETVEEKETDPVIYYFFKKKHL